jgi:hypothetical protein
MESPDLRLENPAVGLQCLKYSKSMRVVHVERLFAACGRR